MDDDGNGGIVPGCGCDAVYVQEIVREMNLRKEGRGKVAQMRQQKCMLEKITQLSLKVPMLLKTLGVEYPPSDATLRRVFPEGAPEMRPLAKVIGMEPLPEFGSSEYEALLICLSMSSFKTFVLARVILGWLAACRLEPRNSHRHN